MSHCHVGRELLRAVADGRLPRGTAGRIVLEHLAARCPTCGREIRRWLAWRAVRGTGEAAWGLTLALQLLLDRLPGQLLELEPELRRARRDLAELRTLAPEARVLRVERARTRFRGPVLAELALAEARRFLPDRPAEARAWARAAGLAAGSGWERRERRSWLAALQARAAAHLANAHRIEGRFPEAEEAYARAWSGLLRGGVTDLAAYAEVACLEASLFRDRRSFQGAEVRLHFSSLLYTALRDLPALTRARLKRGTLYQAWGRPAVALRATEAAEAVLDRLPPGAADPRLRLAARHNRADFLCDLGRFADAAEVLEQSRLLYDLFDDPWTRCRLAWLEGKIARGLGRAEEAEARWRRAREGFLAEGAAFDAALVCLELAALYLDQGRTRELRAIAREMHATFRRFGVHREARAAARYFAGAAAREAVTGELLTRLARYLHEARHRPTLRFEPAG